MLGEKYASEFPSKSAEIRCLWGKVEDDDTGSLKALYRAIHSLAGSGETFGFPALSDAAKQCERVLLAGIETGQLQNEDAKVRLESVLTELDR